MMDASTDFLIDSGAFSAWKLGSPIDIGEYAEFLEANQSLYDRCVNLDVIPGRFAKKPTVSEVEDSAAKSWKNLEYLQRRGLRPIPVFHQGENYYWLERMIKEGYDYIGISPDNGKMIAQKREWMDEVFDHITVGGLPIVKTHGFAVTSIDMIFRYPWKSIDSATWIVLGAFGGTFVPRYGANGFMYDRSPYVVHVSSTDSSSLRTGSHFYNYSKAMQRRIEQFFNGEGYDLKDVEDTFEARSVICLRVLKRVQEYLAPSRFSAGRPSLFSRKPFAQDYEPISIDQKLIYYAISCAAVYSDMLTVERLNRRLVTYYILRDKDSEFYPFYARTGVFPKGKTWKRWVDADELERLSIDEVEINRTDAKQTDRSRISSRSRIDTDLFGNEQINTRKRNWKRT